MTKKRSAFLLALLPLWASAQLRINELMPKNVSYLLDESLNYSMWVEVYNTSTTALDLKDYWFSDRRDRLFRWKPASTSIPPQGFSVLFFEREDRAGHASFKLDPNGGCLYLSDQQGQPVDSLIYPAQYRNLSYGRRSDGAGELVFFTQPSPGATNQGKATGEGLCPAPAFSLPGGFHATSQLLRLSAAVGDTVYYTTDCSEPTRTSTRYNLFSPLNLTTNTVVRARAFGKGKIPSDIVTQTYFINNRNHHLPVLSLSTEQRHLTDPKTGIYCNGDGTNGLPGNGQTANRNYNCDWNRPINLELYDTTGLQVINQEVDTKIMGGWTRAYAAKSMALSPKKKFGKTKLEYDLFPSSKPGHRYKDIMLRNSGNDFYYSMMRDGLMQTLVAGRLPSLDYMAYEAAVLYLNGAYWGIENLRERSNEDWVYSNYGLDEDEVQTIEATIDLDTDKDIATDTSFQVLADFVRNHDMTSAETYAQVCRMMDVDNFMAYMMAEIYTGNTDWPHNNVKMWRQRPDGPWHWILSDLDFGMNLYSSLENSNTLSVAMGESGSKPEWSTILLKRLMLNDAFRNAFIDRYAVHLSTTFLPARVNHLADSLAARIAGEIGYHKSRFSSSRSLEADLGVMKTFAALRPGVLLGQLGSRFLASAPLRKLRLESNRPEPVLGLNGQHIPDPSAELQYFKDRSFRLSADELPGYRFDHWEKTPLGSIQTLLPMGSMWRYYDGNAVPAPNWATLYYPDAGWTMGRAPLGYGGRGELTTIGFGSDAAAKYPTSYFRTRFNLTGLAGKSNFNLTVYVDDGAAVYVNGTEVGRVNLPTGTLAFATYATTYNNGVTATFAVPSSLLKEGENLIAVEVHQCNAGSSDVVFDLSLSAQVDEPSATTSLPDRVLDAVMDLPVAYRAVYVPEGTEVSAAPAAPTTVSATLVTDGFTVRTSPGTVLALYDLSGRLRWRQVAVQLEERIDCSNWPAGIYWLKADGQVFRLAKR